MVETQSFLSLTSSVLNELKEANSFTFQSDDVEPANKRPAFHYFKTPEKAFRDITGCKENKIEDFSHKTDYKPKILASNMNGIMSALYWSYLNHYPLKLSVSDFILMIGQGLAKHMEVYAEELRKEFVDFEGKEEITIDRNDIVPGAKNDWSTLFGQFTEEIKKRVKTDLYDVMIDDTSVATKLSRISSEIAIMDSYKHFFDYRLRFACGIPKITLVGKKEDWEKLNSKVQRLKELNTDDRLKLNWWLERLVPLVTKIVEQATSRNIDKEFWKEIYQYHDRALYEGGPNITGWINIFNPYLTGRQQVGETKNSFVHKCQTIYERNPFSSMSEGKTAKYGEISPERVISGTSRVPLKWLYSDKEVPMTLHGGFLGAQMLEDMTIEPVYFYSVTYD